MECNAALNISCNFNGYLVCQMPTNTVEVELKIKTTWGKYTLSKDMCTRTERYCPWDRVDRRTKIHTKRRRTTRREADTKTMTTSSETDIQNGEAGWKYQFIGSQPTQTSIFSGTVITQYLQNIVLWELFIHRAKTISSNNEKLQQEDDHLTRALGNCNYPRWAVNRVKMRMNNPNQKKKKNNKNTTTKHPKTIHNCSIL